MPARTEILISGYGGQGVFLMGRTLGSAAVRQGLFPSMLLSHGTETRGGYVRSQVVLAHEPVDNPTVESPDFFCALSQAAYDRFIHLVDRGVVLYDPAAVNPAPGAAGRLHPLSAGHLAQQIGNPVVVNTIFLGRLTRLLAGTLDREPVLATLLQRVGRHGEVNRQAFEAGYGSDSQAESQVNGRI
jgi:2-oxoglutarate ferredoxin oxidoreductase subunit gamma